MKRKISFRRDGLTLVGNLFTPENFDQNGRYEAVLVQGSFTSVKEQMAGAYAEKFAGQCFVALSFGYAHYGESEGTPRQLEDPAEKLADLQAAVTYLLDLPYVSAVGVCTSASNITCLAAHDDRVKAIATIAGFVITEDVFTTFYGADGIAQRREQTAAAKKVYAETGATTVIASHSETEPNSVNYFPTPGAFDYYTNPARGGVPEYTNGTDVQSWEGFLSLDPLSQAPKVTIPTMVVHSDERPGNPTGLRAAARGGRCDRGDQQRLLHPHRAGPARPVRAGAGGHRPRPAPHPGPAHLRRGPRPAGRPAHTAAAPLEPGTTADPAAARPADGHPGVRGRQILGHPGLESARRGAADRPHRPAAGCPGRRAVGRAPAVPPLVGGPQRRPAGVRLQDHPPPRTRRPGPGLGRLQLGRRPHPTADRLVRRTRLTHAQKFRNLGRAIRRR